MIPRQDTPPGGLEATFVELRPALLRHARSMGVDNDAEDVLQDVWLRLREAQAPVAHPQAYLYRMVYTAVLDRKRAERRRAARDGAWHESSADDAAAPPAVERTLVARETLARVEARLLALGEPTNTLFRRHRLSGETQRRLAAEFGLGLSTVEKYLRRAYAALLEVRADDEV